jgi:hypothetical protein
MKKISPAKFSANYITKTFFSHIDVEEINCGDCYNWAYLAYKVFHKCDIELWSTYAWGHHAFIKIGNRFYDAESPRGVKNYRNLHCFKDPEYKDFSPNSRKQTLREFKRFWSGALNPYRLDQEIEEEVSYV